MADSDRRELSNSLGVALRANNRALQSTIWTALPGFIVDYDATKQTCSVQTTILAKVLNDQGVTNDVKLPVLVDCPVCFPCGGGFALTFPIQPNDECLVIFSSRCIDSWWHSSGIQVQTELRMHDLSDGFVIPGPRSLPNALLTVSTTDVQLRNVAGTTTIGINPAGVVKVIAPEADVTAPLVAITGNVTITGTLTVGGIVSAMDFTAPTGSPFGYLEHKHNVLHGTDLGPPVKYTP